MTRSDFLPALSRAGVTSVTLSGTPWPASSQARLVVVREGIALGMRSTDIAALCGVTPAAIRYLARSHKLGSWGSPGRPRWSRRIETPAVRRVSLLVADDRQGLMPRRRRHCAKLFACEDDWIRDHLAASGSTGGQARCPPGCQAYAPRLGGPAEGAG